MGEKLQKLANKGELYNIGILPPAHILCLVLIWILDSAISFGPTIRPVQIPVNGVNYYTEHKPIKLHRSRWSAWFKKITILQTGMTQ